MRHAAAMEMHGRTATTIGLQLRNIGLKPTPSSERAEMEV
jgi:hypothetical protein